MRYRTVAGRGRPATADREIRSPEEAGPKHLLNRRIGSAREDTQSMTDEPMPPHVAMIRIMQGMWLSQIASAVAQLGIADQIAAGVNAPADLARACGADAGALTRLMRAATTIGIFDESAPSHF